MEGLDPAYRVGSDLSEGMETQVCLPAWRRTPCPLEPGLAVGVVDYPSKGHLAFLWEMACQEETKSTFLMFPQKCLQRKGIFKSLFFKEPLFIYKHILFYDILYIYIIYNIYF